MRSGRQNSVGFELDDPKVKRGPAGTVPILRPDLSRLTRTVALKDFHLKRGGLLVNKHRPNKQPSDPNPAGYFHDTDSQSGTFYGWEGNLNVWDPSINIPSAPGDDHSILQVWLQNYDKPQLHSVEGGWTVDQGLNGDSHPHLFTYYTNNGYTANGDNQGGYNAQSKVGCSTAPRITRHSASSGQHLGRRAIRNIDEVAALQEPVTGELNFWLAVNGLDRLLPRQPVQRRSREQDRVDRLRGRSRFHLDEPGPAPMTRWAAAGRPGGRLDQGRLPAKSPHAIGPEWDDGEQQRRCDDRHRDERRAATRTQSRCHEQWKFLGKLSLCRRAHECGYHVQSDRLQHWHRGR